MDMVDLFTTQTRTSGPDKDGYGDTGKSAGDELANDGTVLLNSEDMDPGSDDETIPPVDRDLTLLERGLRKMIDRGTAFLTLGETARMLGCSRQAIYEMRRNWTEAEAARARGETEYSIQSPYLAWVNMGPSAGGIRIPVTGVIRLLHERHSPHPALIANARRAHTASRKKHRNKHTG